VNRIQLYFACLLLVLSPGAGAREPADYGRYAPSAYQGVLVNWNSGEGRARLARADYKEDFYQLAHHYQAQVNGLYCGIASSVMVLNALRTGRLSIPSQKAMEVQIPSAWGGQAIAYPLYAQPSFLDEKTEKVKPRSVIEFREAAANGKPDPGLTLQQLRGVLEAHGARAVAHHADMPEAEGVAAFRQYLKQMLGEGERFVIVNYDSRRIGQMGGGHISPLAAYDGASDSALVLDVSGHLNPWLWVPVRDLYLAMHTRDGETYRGYVIVSEGISE
jgi:hypothetical protein